MQILTGENHGLGNDLHLLSMAHAPSFDVRFVSSCTGSGGAKMPSAKQSASSELVEVSDTGGLAALLQGSRQLKA
jgi:hypothetical protein